MAPEPTPAPEGDATPPPAPDPTPAPEPTDELLGEGGLRALQAERQARAAAEQREKDLQAQLADLQAAQMTDQEKAVADAKSAGRAEATGEFLKDLFGASVQVAAVGKLQDPSLLEDPDVALKLLGLTEVPTIDGKVDSATVAAKVAELVATRPSLAATNGGVPNPGSADGGARGTGTPPSIADQIAQAEKVGDWTTAGQLKAQQLIGLQQTT